MNNLKEKIKDIDKAQIAVYVGIGIIILFCIYGLFFNDSDAEEIQNVEMETPENRDQVKDYESKLEAYNKENEKTKDDVSLEFNIDAFKKDTEKDIDSIEKKEQLKKQVDSMLATKKEASSATEKPIQQKRTASNSGGSGGSGRSRRKEKKIEKAKNRKKEVNKSFSDFFKSNPKKENISEVVADTDAFIYAVIHGNHTIQQGERVKLRLTKSALISGKQYAANSYIYAAPTFQKNRVLLEVTSINHTLVSISAYDTEDGSIGLYVKGAGISGEIVDQSKKTILDDIDVKGIPVGSTIKKVFQKKQEVQKVSLLNDTKLILKPIKK